MNSLRRTILTTSILALTASAAFAQTWTGGGDGVSWNQPTNWTSLPVSGPGAFIQFTNAAPLVTNQNLANPFTLSFLQQTTTGNLTINGNALNFQGSNPNQINLNSLNATINAPVVMTGNLAFFTTNLTLAGGLSGPGGLQLGNSLVTLTGPGSWTGGTNLTQYGSGTLRVAAPGALSGNVSFGSNNGGLLEFASPTALTYSGSITGFSFFNNTVRQSGPGTLLLNGVSSSFSGTMQVTTGATLQSGGPSALGSFSGVQVQSGGTLQMAANNSLTGPQDIAVAAGGTLDAGGFQQTTAVQISNAGTVFLPLGSDVAVGGSGVWTGGSTGLGALTFAGFLNFNTGSSLTHTGGTLQLGGFNSINTSNVLPNVGQLRISGGTLTHYATDTVDTILVDGGALNTTTFTATGAVDMQTGSLAGTSVTINGAFTKTTAGAATVGGFGSNITLTAGGTVSAGILNVSGALNGAVVNNAAVTVNGGSLNGATTNTGTLTLNSGSATGTVVNSGTIVVSNATLAAAVNNTGTVNSVGSDNISGNISGPGNFTATGANTTLTGINSYTGSSTATSSAITGTTDSIQGAWAITGSGLNFTQAFTGTMSGAITGTGLVTLQGPGFVTLSGSNTFDQGVSSNAPGAHFGFGSNTAAGIGGTVQSFVDFKMSAVGGARTIANPLLFSPAQTDFTGANNLTFTNTTAKTLSGVSEILHTSTAITSIAGTFLGQNTTTINVNAGTLILGAAVNNGFRMDGAINVASGGTLQMISNSPVKLGPTSLTGGTLIAGNGVAVPTGLALTARGNILARVSSEAGSLIEAFGGALTMGDATSFGGFFSNGELRTLKNAVTLLDKNQAVLGSLTELGDSGTPGTLTAANGVFVDFGRAITGYGTIAGTNALPQATIINGDAAGNSGTEPLDFTGYVKGLGTFTDVTFSGTFSPGLSPAIVPVNNVNFGASSTLLMEIGGLTAGSQFDQLDIGGTLGLNGLLDVDLINGFNPALGDTFNILDGTTSGTFNAFSFPALSPGLSWDTSDLYTIGNLKIVPEPSAAMLMLAGAAALIRRRRR